eukprot:2812701-Rhodomonas_salina.2
MLFRVLPGGGDVQHAQPTRTCRTARLTRRSRRRPQPPELRRHACLGRDRRGEGGRLGGVRSSTGSSWSQAASCTHTPGCCPLLPGI